MSQGGPGRGHPREVPCASDTLVRRLDLVGIAIGCPVERSSTSPLSETGVRPESSLRPRFRTERERMEQPPRTQWDAGHGGRCRSNREEVARTFSTLMAETWLAARCIGVLEDPPERSRRTPPPGAGA